MATSKKIKAITLTDTQLTGFAHLGNALAGHEQHAIAQIKAIATATNLKEARNMFVAGQVIRLHWSKDVSADLISKARAIMSKGGAGSDKPEKRTQDEETAVNSAAKVWSRLSAAAGLERADKRGRKKGAKPGKPAGGKKIKPVTVKVGKIDTGKQLVDVIAHVKQAWAAMLVNSKALDLPNEVATLGSEITVLINKYEGAVAAASKASK
jgi:hypothetical protein